MDGQTHPNTQLIYIYVYPNIDTDSGVHIEVNKPFAHTPHSGLHVRKLTL